ncbi:MAG: cation transporter [Desulfurococcales archaeon]|nr:cation transporter [Desulfurococcales archaeon]
MGNKKTSAFAIALAFSALGGLLKLLGGYKYGSLAVLTDGVTCVANLISGAFILYMLHVSLLPPDKDHPYGHRRYIYSGILSLIIAYSLAAGFNVALLILRPPGAYTVEGESALYALLGGAMYGVAVYVASKTGLAGRSYAGFTASEILESLISAGSAAAGAYIASALDYLGAVGITLYIFVELYNESKRIHLVLVEWAHPALHSRVKRLFEGRGLKVRDLRLRLYEHGLYKGDITVEPREGIPIDVAELLADEAAHEAKTTLDVELVVRLVGSRREEISS